MLTTLIHIAMYSYEIKSHLILYLDLPSAGQEEVHMALDMGGFSPEGVVEIPPVCEAEELNGLPLGRTGPRILYMVRLQCNDLKII